MHTVIPSQAILNHKSGWLDLQSTDLHSHTSSPTSSVYCMLETSELHQYQQLFGHEHDPPLVHTLTTHAAASHIQSNSSMRLLHPEHQLTLLEEECVSMNDDDLSAFTPRDYNQTDEQMNALMMQSTDSYDFEDQQIIDDLETARELYSLLQCDNEAVAQSNVTAVSSKSSTPTFHIDPIQTRWDHRNTGSNSHSGTQFFLATDYRNPREDDTFSNTVVDQGHNNTARTPSSCSTMDDSINSVLRELAMQT